MRLLLAAVAVPVVWAGDFAIDWWSVDGGGGMSAGGQYALAGAMGQADAGTMRGGRCVMEGGLWPGIGFGGDARPVLFIRSFADAVTVSWSPASAAISLETTEDLSSAAWTRVPGGTASPVTVPAGDHARFYRLNGK